MIGKFKVAALMCAAIVLTAAALFAATPSGDTAEAAPQGQVIYAKALTDHGCDSSEWHFVITQVDTRANAPSHIHVTFSPGGTHQVNLEKYTGKTAHYTTTVHLGSTVTSASADIYGAWGTRTGPGTNGQFNLSHGPCVSSPTPTPTLTPTPTPPSGTPTPTPTPTVVPSPTPTPPLNPTPSPVDTVAPDGTVIPVGTSVDQAPAPVGFPDTGGAPACDDCDCTNKGILTFALGAALATVIGIVLAVMTRWR